MDTNEHELAAERITAFEYLAAAEKARRNGADKPAFRRLEEDIKRLPKTKERLTFELLKIARAALDQGKNRGMLPTQR